MWNCPWYQTRRRPKSATGLEVPLCKSAKKVAESAHLASGKMEKLNLDYLGKSSPSEDITTSTSKQSSDLCSRLWMQPIIDTSHDWTLPICTGEAGKGPVPREVKLGLMNKSFWTVKAFKAFKGDSKKPNLETGSTYVPHPWCVSCAAASHLPLSPPHYTSRVLAATTY